MTSMPVCRRAAVVTVLSGCLLSGAAVASAAGTMAQAGELTSQKALIDKYCVGCHNQRLLSGGLALDSVDIARVGDHPDVWEKVVRKLRARLEEIS